LHNIVLTQQKKLCMKKLLLTLVFLNILIGASAQNIGIGTTSPNASALLDLSSTTRGLLLPRVSTTQMFAIDNPANGLMVFNTTYNQLYHYDGGTWRSVLNGTHWSRPIASRDIMSNTSDSIGIGITLPTRFMDVNGTMRVRGTFTADGGINAGSMIVSNTFLAGSGVVQGSLQINDELVVNNAAGILQFRAGATNLGFLQLNGNDLRIGTNSGNDNGKLVIRTNGADRVSVDEEGVLNITNKITSSSTGSAPLTPLCWGVTATAANGGIARGTANTSVQRLGLGYYRITCPGITENSCAILTPFATGTTIAALCNNGYVDVYIRRSDNGDDVNQSFYFLIY
jgi:hypothetical protein